MPEKNHNQYYLKKIMCCHLVICGFVSVQCHKKTVDMGNASLSGAVMHHNDSIPNAKVYLKINALEFPGTFSGLYDDSLVCHEWQGYNFSHLKKGNYYLYSIGYDSSIHAPVSGGLPVKIDVAGKNIHIDIAVTE